MSRAGALAVGLMLLARAAVGADLAVSGDASLARVIVQFKPGAALLRERALSARSSATETRNVLDARARTLGARRGITLAAAAAVGERTQVMLASGTTSAALAQKLAQDADVEYAVPDERRRRLAVPDDPLYATGGPNGPAVGQWYLKPPAGDAVSSIDAQSAWDITTGSPSIVVAVLDTGVRFDHADLAGRVLPGYDMVSDAQVANDGSGRDADASDPGDWVTAAEAATPPFDGCTQEDSSWHGTKTSALIGAATNNGLGMAGVGWQVRLLPVRVLGKCFGNDSDILAGMRWAAGLAVPGVPANPTPARVLNMSLGSGGACSDAYKSAISEIAAHGAVVVAAAGNSVGRAVGAPANCPGVIGVAGLRHIGTKVGFSDLGPEISISAPAGNCVNLTGACLYPILTATNAGTTTPVADSSIYTDAIDASVGTSFSAPLVAGTAALMLSANATLAPADVRSLMRSSARPFPTSGAPPEEDGTPVPICQAPGDFDQLQCYCTTTTCGAGMLDASAAVAAAASAPIVAPPPGETTEPPVTGGGGGGAMGALPLLGLAIAALMLRRRAR